MRTRVCGTTEERINRFMRMCLEWQYDLRKGIVKRDGFYFKKYNVGKYSLKYFADIKDSVIDRQFVINKMNSISAGRQQRDRNLGIKRNKVVIRQFFTLNDGERVKSVGIQMKDDSVLKNVARSKLDKNCYDLNDVPHEILVKYMKKKGYIVIDQDKILKKVKIIKV